MNKCSKCGRPIDSVYRMTCPPCVQQGYMDQRLAGRILAAMKRTAPHGMERLVDEVLEKNDNDSLVDRTLALMARWPWNIVYVPGDVEAENRWRPEDGDAVRLQGYRWFGFFVDDNGREYVLDNEGTKHVIGPASRVEPVLPIPVPLSEWKKRGR